MRAVSLFTNRLAHSAAKRGFIALAALSVAAVVGQQSARAQVAVLPGVTTYGQDFNSLASQPGGTSNGTNLTWNNNSTIQGWYLQSSLNGIPSTVQTSDGSGGTSPSGLPENFYSFGTVGSTDRALGSVAGDTGDSYFYGLQLFNASGNTINAFQVNLTLEQWYNSNNPNTHGLQIQYLVTANSGNQLLVAGYSAVQGGNTINAPQTGNTSPAGALNGNLTANQANATFSQGSLGWAPNTYLWVRWRDANDTNTNAGNTSLTDPLTDHAMSLDNLNFTFQPTPAPPSLVSLGIGSMVGVAHMGVLRLRRRRRSNGKTEEEAEKDAAE